MYDSVPQISLWADEYNQLVKRYKEILPRVHQNLSEEELDEMAQDSAYMQMHMEGKI